MIIQTGTITSTNDYLRDYVPADDITIVRAQYQTNGRGQSGTWISEPGLNLLFSMLLVPSNLSVGDGTSIPKGSTIYCTDAPCTIGKKVIFGPKPTIITGDHRIDVIGKHLIDVTVKEKFVDGINPYDLPVVIEDGCWIGANVTILKGVTIGRGSIVAAGAVVNKSCEPYSVIGGIPAKLLKMRFTPEQIIEHERLLNANH